MATLYSDINNKFSFLINDSSHLNYTNEEIDELFSAYLSFAVFYTDDFIEATPDDITFTMVEDLTDREQWILAHGMVVCWLKPLMQYEGHMQVTIADRDYTPSSSANQLDKLINLYMTSVEELEGHMMGYSYFGDGLADLAT